MADEELRTVSAQRLVLLKRHKYRRNINTQIDILSVCAASQSKPCKLNFTKSGLILYHYRLYFLLKSVI